MPIRGRSVDSSSAPSPLTTRPQSFTPLTVAALPAADDDGGGAREAAEAELRWLTGRMLAIAARADHRGAWGFTSAATSGSLSEPVGDGGGLTPSDELIFNRFGEGFSDTNFAWHKDDAEPGPRDISVVLYFTDPAEFEGGELQLQCDTALARLPAEADYSGKQQLSCLSVSQYISACPPPVLVSLLSAGWHLQGCSLMMTRMRKHLTYHLHALLLHRRMALVLACACCGCELGRGYVR